MNEAELRAKVLSELRVAVVPIRNVEFRDQTATPDGSWTMSGLASVYDQETVIYDGTFYKRREKIQGGAFDAVLRTSPLVHFNLGHDMNRAVAATDVPGNEMGSLTLRSTPEGLEYLAKVDPEDPDAFAMGIKMKRGVIKQASFAFTVRSDKYEEEEFDGKIDELRTILEIKDLYDVCATPQGAYNQTTAGVRSLFAQYAGQPDIGGPQRQPDEDRGAEEEEARAASEQAQRRLIADQARVAALRLDYTPMKEN